jgi:hypothetical protein
MHKLLNVKLQNIKAPFKVRQLQLAYDKFSVLQSVHVICEIIQSANIVVMWYHFSSYYGHFGIESRPGEPPYRLRLFAVFFSPCIKSRPWAFLPDPFLVITDRNYCVAKNRNISPDTVSIYRNIVVLLNLLDNCGQVSKKVHDLSNPYIFTIYDFSSHITPAAETASLNSIRIIIFVQPSIIQ